MAFCLPADISLSNTEALSYWQEVAGTFLLLNFKKHASLNEFLREAACHSLNVYRYWTCGMYNRSRKLRRLSHEFRVACRHCERARSTSAVFKSLPGYSCMQAYPEKVLSIALYWQCRNRGAPCKYMLDLKIVHSKSWGICGKEVCCRGQHSLTIDARIGSWHSNNGCRWLHFSCATRAPISACPSCFLAIGFHTNDPFSPDIT